MANFLDKSALTIQKYEYDEAEISLSMIAELVKALNTTSTFLLGYEIKTICLKIKTFSNVLSPLF